MKRRVFIKAAAMASGAFAIPKARVSAAGTDAPQQNDTKTVNFPRSYMRFRRDLDKKPLPTISTKPVFAVNNVRIQLECRLTMTERQSGQTHTFVMGASCKTERVGAQHNLFTRPNADFIPVFSAEEFMIIKTYARMGTKVKRYPPSKGVQPNPQWGSRDEIFDSSEVSVHECPAEVLSSSREIVEAAFAGDPLVARTEITQGPYVAVLEYPIKTININERKWFYQTDNGPVLLPDFSRDPASLIKGFQLAYAAFNCPDWTEFIVRKPTEVGDGMQVFHYSGYLRYNAHNDVLRLRNAG